jgi:hypothetical protein
MKAILKMLKDHQHKAGSELSSICKFIERRILEESEGTLMAFRLERIDKQHRREVAITLAKDAFTQNLNAASSTIR